MAVYINGPSDKKRGRLVIINIERFDKNTLRSGTEEDEKRLLQEFGPTGFDYHVTVHHDRDQQKKLTRQRVEEKIRELSDENFDAYSNLVFVFLTHGGRGALVCSDGQVLPILQLLNYFSEPNCPQLRNKEKIFLFQCCLGNRNNYGCSPDETNWVGTKCEHLDLMQNHLLTQHGLDQTDHPDNVLTDQGLAFCNVPPFRNFLIGFATFPGDYAWKNSGTGSRFIQHLCQEIRNDVAKRLDVESLLVQTANQIAYGFRTENKMNDELRRYLEANYPLLKSLYDRECLQIPCTISTLKNKVYFRPPSVHHVLTRHLL